MEKGKKWCFLVADILTIKYQNDNFISIRIPIFCSVLIFQHIHEYVVSQRGLQPLPLCWMMHILWGRNLQVFGEKHLFFVSSFRFHWSSYVKCYCDVFLILWDLQDASKGGDDVDIDGSKVRGGWLPVRAIGILERHWISQINNV